MVTKNERCGNCKYHKKDVGTGEWICCCPDAEEYGDYTDYRHSCPDWEGKNG